MAQYNAIIIDDELNVQQTLEILILQNCPQISILDKACSAEEGRMLIKTFDIHLIFLDISMPGENGFDFLASINKENFAIIFTTAHEEYALKAIKANAIDYLLKPINPLELIDAVEKATSYLDMRLKKDDIQKIYEKSLENLIKQIQNGNQLKKITVVEKFGFRIVDVDLIRYLEADSNYTILHLSGLEKIVSSKSLGEFEKVLELNSFFRIHKSTIINLKYLKGFSSYQGYFAIMDDNSKLTISRRRFNEFRDVIETQSKSVD